MAGSNLSLDRRPKNSNSLSTTLLQIDQSHRIPIIEPGPKKYTPIPYVFRLPATPFRKAIKATTKCPPFHVQLDHAIAVVWTLYSQKQTTIPLGINQLQWAYSFLDNIQDKVELHPEDIEHCLTAISDEMLEMYADLAEDVMSDESEKDVTNRSSSGPPIRCICPPPDKRRPKAATSKESTEKAYKPDMKKITFSFTYNDMKQHQHDLRDEQAEKRRTTDSNMNAYLNEWRKDQLQKILSELDRLHTIEKYIGNSRKGFAPYMNEEDIELKDYITKQLAACQSKCKENNARNAA